MRLLSSEKNHCIQKIKSHSFAANRPYLFITLIFIASPTILNQTNWNGRILETLKASDYKRTLHA